MIGTNAGPIVAGMTDRKSGRDVSEMKDPRNAMNSAILPRGMNVSITTPVRVSRPYPTLIGLFNLRPEASFQLAPLSPRRVLVGASTTAIFTRRLPERIEYALAI